jgi:ornithine cyclodeaminase/alanine dehydrogenase-like protein (mu-crystallin family)
MTLLLAHEDIEGILAPDEVREAVLTGILEQSKGQVQVPPRITIDAASGLGWLRLMPVVMNGSKLMGFKAMHSTPGVGVRYLVMLYAMDTGELLAQMDADWLTSQRTSATAAIGVDILAKEEIAEVGILGSSEQARAMLRAVVRVRKLPKVKVFSPTKENRNKFADTIGKSLGLDIVPVETARAVVEGSDLVLSVFRAGREPLIDASWVEAGTHINASSSIRPEARELKDNVWAKCDVIAFDDRAHAFESGDGASAVAGGLLSPGRTTEIWEIFNGSEPGRRNSREITLFKAVGTGLQDVSLAAAIYAKAKALARGRNIGDFPRVRK